MEHKIMLIQGENWIVLTLQDKVGGTLAKRVGTWREPTSDTSDGKEVYIVESIGQTAA